MARPALLDRAPSHPPAAGGAAAGSAPRERTGWRRAPLVLAGALTLFLAFRAGGFFPGATGLAAVVVALALAARVTVARAPFAGWSAGAGLAAGALALLAAWTLVSGSWSGAPGRALLEFDRTLLYLLLLVLFASFARRPGDLAWTLRWVAAAIVVVAVAALVTRLAPELASAAEHRPERLAFPLTYWNALGMLCALGALLALHAASGDEEPALVRVLATAALPLLVVAGYFTFSRGAIAALALGALLYAALARPRGLLPTVLVAAPTTLAALAAAYGADTLATAEFAAGEGPAQGRRVALVLGAATLVAALARAALLRLEGRQRAGGTPWLAPRAGLAVLALLVVLAVAGALAADLPGRARTALGEGGTVQETGDARDRIGARQDNGRRELWRVAVDLFAEAPVTGVGAGSFRVEWEQRRPRRYVSGQGHSLYLETLGELGLVGLALLLVALLTPVALALRRLRAPDGHAHAAFVAAGVALLVHAAIDWDWEMPVLFAWLFAAGGLALAAPAASAPARSLGRPARLFAGLACLLVAVTPALVVRSQGALDRGVRAFRAGDCRGAADGALDSLGALGERAEPYELLGYCNARAGAHASAARAMRAAIRRDPENWQYHYGLAAVRALAGANGRPAAERARRLNPHEPLAEALATGLRTSDPRTRRRVAARARVPSE